MNDLVRRYDELHALIKKGMESDAKELDPASYVIKAPIPVPGQDIIRLCRKCNTFSSGRGKRGMIVIALESRFD